MKTTPVRHPECTHPILSMGACCRCTSYAILLRRMYVPERGR